MRKYLILYAIATTVALSLTARHYARDNRRLRENQTALSQRIEFYRTSVGQSAASVQALRLRCAEFEELRETDASYIRSLKLKLRRVESSATAATATTINLRTILRDTVVVHDTVRLFRWHDSWVAVDGTIRGDSVECRVESCDTLRQIAHRIPRRFLFIRYGTKALRQEITSANPHTKIVYSDYVKIEK